MRIKIVPRDSGGPAGKLADAELEFDDGPLAGLKLVGFGVWQSHAGGDPHVIVPTRTYIVNGERRSFTLLRPIHDSAHVDDVKALILQAYQEHSHRRHDHS